MNIASVTLEGEHVRLEPLSLDHHHDLCEVGFDPDLLQWTESYTPTEAGLEEYIKKAVAMQDRGDALPFAVIHKKTGKAIGSTRLGNIDLHNKKLEIGWTWYAKLWQRTVVNTECKYLLLSYAFETLSCHRVEFKTNALNERSRQAILRLGAKEEGTHRKHMVLPSGKIRDTVYFSIVDTEWPEVKRNLEKKLR